MSTLTKFISQLHYKGNGTCFALRGALQKAYSTLYFLIDNYPFSAYDTPHDKLFLHAVSLANPELLLEISLIGKGKVGLEHIKREGEIDTYMRANAEKKYSRNECVKGNRRGS